MSDVSRPDGTIEQANFLIVMTDDQGWWSMPRYMPELQMPRLEELVEDSLDFTNFYSASPVCSPARASLLTGRAPSAHGVHDWIVGDRAPGALPDRFLEGQQTTPEVLAASGYQCWMSGKWHVGDSRLPAPGFSRWYAHRYGGGPYVGAPVWRDGEPVEEERYLTHAITEEALSFIRERDPDRPFYLQVNYTAPHDPWLEGHPEQYTSLYEDCEFPSVPREPRHEWTLSRSHFDEAYEDPVPRLVGYAASLSAVDAGLGQILDELEAQGLRESTIIIFLSDNGFSCGHHGLWGKGNGTWPLNFWDASVRVPLVVQVPGGRCGVVEAPVSAMALHATICELAGITPPPDRWRAEESIASLLADPDTGDGRVAVVAAEYGMGRMITDGRWVYVLRREGPNELYDMMNDAQQRVNLVDEPLAHEAKERLHRQLMDWYAARERTDESAWDRDIRGFGQIHPVSRGLPDSVTYATEPAPDGNPERD